MAMSTILPLLEFKSPMTAPKNSSGVYASTLIIGSSSMSPAFLTASFSAIEPAILKAISEESTS